MKIAKMSRKDFLPPKLDSESASGTLMKRLLAGAISTVIYSRGIFPADCFADKRLPDEGTVKVLSSPGKENNQDVFKFLQLLQGAFDALDKRYLSAFLLGICCDGRNPDLVCESYRVNIEYKEKATNENDDTAEKISYDVSVQSVTSILRVLASRISSFEQIPNGAFITVKLLYYDECTPYGYEPVGFASSKKPYFEFAASTSIETSVGNVSTTFHSMDFSVRTIFDSNNEMDTNE